MTATEVKYSHYCILDFEATCWERQRTHNGKPMEIIELPTIVVDVASNSIVSTFETYVRPQLNPILDPFCINLTGIQQEWVDNAPVWTDAFRTYKNWVQENSLETALWITCGDWDLKTMLPTQDAPHIPEYLRHWCNVKKAFRHFYGKRANSMIDMLRVLGLELEGRHHSGIDDCRNIARIVQRMIQDGCSLSRTS